MSIRIAPSLLSANFAALGEDIRMVEDAGAEDQAEKAQCDERRAQAAEPADRERDPGECLERGNVPGRDADPVVERIAARIERQQHERDREYHSQQHT